MIKAKLLEISAVDTPAQPDAKMVLRKRDEPMMKLKPREGESKDDFVQRFMGDERMKEEYPDSKQRVAVAMSMFRVKKHSISESDPADPGIDPNEAGGSDNDMTQEQIVALQKRAERAEKALALIDAERELFLKMDEAGQDKFLGLSPADRSAEVKKVVDGNPIVYTDARGRQFRKNDDPRLVEMAKDADEARKARVESEKLARNERIAKRAAEFGNLPGEEGDRVLLLEAIEKVEPDQQTKLVGVLGKLNSEFAKAFARIGTSAVPSEGQTVESKIETLAKGLREKNPSLTEAQAWAAALKTPEGKALYSEFLITAHRA